MLSNYDLLTNDQKQITLKALESRKLLSPLQQAIKPFLEIYPNCPMAFLIPDLKEKADVDIQRMKLLLKEFYNKNSETAVFAATNVVYNQIINGKMYISSHTSLAHLPDIHYYPKTEQSLKIAGSVRAAIKTMHFPFCYNATSNWRNYFWDATYNLEPFKM